MWRRLRNTLIFFAAGFAAARLIDPAQVMSRLEGVRAQRRSDAGDREVSPLCGDGEGAPAPVVADPDVAAV